MLAEQKLSEILRFYQYKLDNHLCTMEEIESVTRAMESNMEAQGTISDFARFYNVPEGHVSSTINRKLISKPKRRVYYRFLDFMKIVPAKWHERIRKGENHES